LRVTTGTTTLSVSMTEIRLFAAASFQVYAVNSCACSRNEMSVSLRSSDSARPVSRSKPSPFLDAVTSCALNASASASVAKDSPNLRPATSQRTRYGAGRPLRTSIFQIRTS